MGGRLQGFARRWRKIGNKEVRRWIKDGVRLDLTSAPEDSQCPPFDSANKISDTVRWQAADATVKKYHQIKVTEIVPKEQEGKGLYMTFFPVAKKDKNGWRGCLDVRPVNELLDHQHFKMEGLHTVRELIRRDDWMATLDVTEAYPHLAIHPEHRQ